MPVRRRHAALGFALALIFGAFVTGGPAPAGSSRPAVAAASTLGHRAAVKRTRADERCRDARSFAGAGAGAAVVPVAPTARSLRAAVAIATPERPPPAGAAARATSRARGPPRAQA